MSKKKNDERVITGETAAIIQQPITETIEQNFMPYAMSVIVARAIPEIDGFKPAHRKLLYTMYKMGLMTGPRTKSANVVGSAMHLNPHGDASIYETLVRLTRGNETLLHPFVDSKGSFGKHYSSDMAYAAQRYTEVKLDPFCSEIFNGINADAVDMVPNYDNTMTEPVLLPTSFPNILVNPSLGIAVGMTSKICSFNLGEVCDAAIQMLREPETTVNQLLDILRAPDFSGGAGIVYNREQMREIYATGRGSFRMRAKYRYDKAENCIDILEIPYSTSIELIMRKIADLVKEGKLKEITDFRDEIDLSGFKLTLDLRRGTDPEQLMLKLFKLTPLEDSFDCNFNVLIDGTPQQLGIAGILSEWIRFRVGCVRRELQFDLGRKQEKLHLLLGLGKIFLDIDRAVQIIRDTELEKDVVPNLMKGFDIDEKQADYIAEIKLRFLNREYILKSLEDVADLQKEIAALTETIASERLLKNRIIKQLKEVKAKYQKPRLTEILYEEDIEHFDEEEHVERYNVRLIRTQSGYFKKITLLSLRGNDEQKLKAGDDVAQSIDAENTDELLFFSDKAQVYKAKVSDFDTCKASELGDFIPAKLGFDEGENVQTVFVVRDYDEPRAAVMLFANGKGVKIPISAYETKTNRRRLTGAYSDASPIVAILDETEPVDFLMVSDADKAVLLSSALVPLKTTRSSSGVALMNLRKGQSVNRVLTDLSALPDPKKYRKTKIPATGVVFAENAGVQITFDTP